MHEITSTLKNYIEKSILPQYEDYDKGHSTDHIESVIHNSLTIAKDYNVNIDMVYTIAVYHDIGIRYGRKDHHITSGKYLIEDTNIKNWFQEEELQLMKEAIEDHRASNTHEPRSIYGKIVAEADRDISLNTILYRTLEYGKKNYPTYQFDEQFERTYDHITEKYGKNGYLKLWLDTKKNIEGLADIREMLKDKESMKELCRKIYNKG